MVRLYAVFFVSGFPALIYQIVWQRSLFTIYGVDSESIAVVVTAFLLGLGIGSLLGGTLSRTRFPLHMPLRRPALPAAPGCSSARRPAG